MELWEEIVTIERQLNDALATFRQNGIKSCEAENNYQIEKSKEILRLRDEGTPTTLIPHIVKGLPNVAKLNFERNVADVVYKANQEAINIKKLQLRVIEAQIEREYNG